MCHVITWSGDVSHRSGKYMRKKDEEWPRTGTFCAAWGQISVMQWPIFTGHFEALRLFPFYSDLTIQPVTYTCTVRCVHVNYMYVCHWPDGQRSPKLHYKSKCFKMAGKDRPLHHGNSPPCSTKSTRPRPFFIFFSHIFS